MKKTAVQQVFSELEKLHPSLFDIHTEKGRIFVNHFHKFIAMEKEQVIEAYRTGVEEDVYNNPLKTGEQYYNETFKSE